MPDEIKCRECGREIPYVRCIDCELCLECCRCDDEAEEARS